MVLLRCDMRLLGAGQDIYQVLLDSDCNIRQYKEPVICNSAGRTVSEAHRVAEQS